MSREPWPPPTAQVAGHAVRLAAREDLDALMEVERAAHHAPWSREVFAREFEVDFSNVWCVEGDLAREQPALIGLLVFWVVHDELHILDVAVHPAARRRGLGRALVELLAAAGQQREMTLITLEVRVSNTPARNLYRATQFEELGQRPRYYADNGEDAIIMTRLL